MKDVTSLWGVLVLIALQSGTHRFSDLRRMTAGVSEKMLAQTLQALQADGFVKRVALPVMPPHVEYSLTRSGKQVADHVKSLADWIETNLSGILRSKRRQRTSI